METLNTYFEHLKKSKSLNQVLLYLKKHYPDSVKGVSVWMHIPVSAFRLVDPRHMADTAIGVSYGTIVLLGKYVEFRDAMSVIPKGALAPRRAYCPTCKRQV